MKAENYQEKLQLWELKNKLMELKIHYHEEEEENKKLSLSSQNYAAYSE
jgi:hypothetical protein